MIHILTTSLTILGLIDLLILSNIRLFYLSSIISIVILLILPGVLLLKVLRIKPSSFWEMLSFVVGLSTSFLIFGGLFINTLLPKVGIGNPLSPLPFLLGFDLLLLILLSIAIYQSKHTQRKINLSFLPKRLKKLDLVFGLSVVIFPILSSIGAIRLNNGGSNVITMIFLGSIGVYVLTLSIFRDKISPGSFPTSIYFIGLSLLLMTSLRSWNISGHDVQYEQYVFQLTKSNGFWSIENNKDAYNACLSITILPTVLSNFIRFNDIYIYKIVFQFIFAFCPVVVYLILKKYTTEILSFLATLYFIMFPTFLNDMPMLNRQEIAFLFFSLLIYVLFKQKRAMWRNVLLFIFGFGTAVSHYSTNYIAVGLLTIVYLTHLLMRTWFVKKFLRKYFSRLVIYKKSNKFYQGRFISAKLVIALIIFTFFWNSLLTKTSGSLTETLTQTIANIDNIFKEDNKSVDVAYSIFFSRKTTDHEFLNSYIKSSIDNSREESLEDFYEPSTYANYKSEVVQNEFLPLTYLGNILKDHGSDVFNLNYLSRQFFAKFIQVLIAVGLLGIFFLKAKKKYDTEYVIACFVSVFFIAIMIILPELSLSYGLLRLFQQSLILLGLPVILGSALLLKTLREEKKSVFMGIFSIIFFLNLSGFISELTGGYYPQYNLENKGMYYDAYYVHDAEVFSIQWLSRHMAEGYTVQADPITRDKLLTYGPIYTLDGNIPQIIQKSAYVYSGYFNTKGNTIVSVDRSLVIKFPLIFLDNNKDLIYDNGQSRIYK